MIVEREDNSALYFIVGALLIAVAAFAIYYFSAGGHSVSDTGSDITTRVENNIPASPAPAPSSSTSTLSVSPNANGGGSVSTTTQTQQ